MALIGRRSRKVFLRVSSKKQIIFMSRMDRPDIQQILIHSGTDGLTDSIQLTNDVSQPLPFKVGDVIAQYGAPCLVVRGDISEDIILLYPKMIVRAILYSNPDNSDVHPLQ